MAMIRKRAFLLLAVGVLMGIMAVAASADYLEVGQYGPADTSMSNDVRSSDSQPDAWDLREAMETGALPGQPVGSSDEVCCGGIEGPTIESGGQLFRPELDGGS